MNKKKIVEYKLAEGESIFIEIDEPAQQGVKAVSKGASKLTPSFEEALDKIKPAVTALTKTLRELADSPDEAAVEFGVKLSTNAGVVFASAAAETNFVFKLTWKRKP